MKSEAYEKSLSETFGVSPVKPVTRWHVSDMTDYLKVPTTPEHMGLLAYFMRRKQEPMATYFDPRGTAIARQFSVPRSFKIPKGEK